MKAKGRNGVVVDVGANVGMATFAAAVMGFRVLALEPVFENLQRICDGIFFNRLGESVTVFEAAASDRVGNITFHKVFFLFCELTEKYSFQFCSRGMFSLFLGNKQIYMRKEADLC